MTSRAATTAPQRAPAKERRPKPEQAAPRRQPSELERTEARIQALEAEIAALEAKLAEDWANVDTLTAHRTARDELQSLLARWEELFQAQQA